MYMMNWYALMLVFISHAVLDMVSSILQPVIYVCIENAEEADEYNYKDMVRRDKRRWEKADSDGDGDMTQEEFALFLHPEESEKMRDIVVEVSPSQ